MHDGSNMAPVVLDDLLFICTYRALVSDYEKSFSIDIFSTPDVERNERGFECKLHVMCKFYYSNRVRSGGYKFIGIAFIVGRTALLILTLNKTSRVVCLSHYGHFWAF